MSRSTPPRRTSLFRLRLTDFNRITSRWTSRLPAPVVQVLQDPYLWALLIVALVVNLGLFAYLIFEISRTPPGIPPLVPLHFDASGQADRIEPRDALFSLAQIGLIIILGNIALGGFMYRRERLASYLLAATSILIQVLLWVAAIQIVLVANS